MPDISSSTTLDSLRQSIEALSLEVALRDLSSREGMQPLVPMLAQIGQYAKSAGIGAIAEIAASTPDTEPAWLHAVARMQQVFAEPEPQAAPAALNQDPELVADFIMESRSIFPLSRLNCSRWSRILVMRKPSTLFFADSTRSKAGGVSGI